MVSPDQIQNMLSVSSKVTERPKGVRPIVAFAHHPWVEPEWMNRQQLLSRLGKQGWPVAYSSGALDWWQRETVGWHESPLLNSVEDRDNIRNVVPGRLGTRWRRYPAFDRFALKRHAQFVRSAIADPHERIVVLIFNPAFYPYIEYLQPCDVVFHAYDVYARQSGWNDEKSAFQDALVKESVLVTASSEAIARYLEDPRVRVLPNGADFESFAVASNHPEPDDLREIPHPRLGYVGAINRKVDCRLIAEIARREPNWHWVLVGRIERDELLADAYNSELFAECEGLPNVHFLGQKDRRDVPAYVGHMDVNTMCYRTDGDGWWIAGSPLKQHEYLATGLPAISSPIEAVLPFSDVVGIGKGVDEWCDLIQDILTVSDESVVIARRSVARQYSWDAIAERHDLWIREAISREK